MTRSIQKLWQIIFVSLFLTSLFVAFPVHAKKNFEDAGSSLNIVADKTGHEKTTVDEFIPKVIQTAFAAVGATFLALMVYAGMKWMLARGNEENITTARSTLVNATIGLIVIVSAYAITSFVTSRIIDGQSAGTQAGTNTQGEDAIGCCQFETASAWGQAMLTKPQCKQWKETHPNVTKFIWGYEDAIQCKKIVDEKNDIFNKIAPPDINIGI